MKAETPQSSLPVTALRSERPSGRRLARGKELGLILSLAAAYFALGRIGLAFSFMRPSITSVWPPSGIAVAGLLIFGYRVWPAVFLGALAVALTTPCDLLTSILLALTNTLESFVGAWLADRFAHGRHFFQRPWDVVKYAVLVGVMSPLLSPPLGVRVVSWDRFILWASDASTGFNWWLGDVVSLVVLTPLILVWADKPGRRLTWRQAVEFGVLILLVVAAGEAIFGQEAPASVRGYLSPYLCLPLLFWAAFRFSEREMMTVTFVLGGLLMWDTLHGYGLFSQVEPEKDLLVYQGFLATASVMSLCLAAVVGERRRATQELVEANRVLRMISGCNQALVRITDERKLIQEICDLIISLGGYRMAWVGFAEPDQARSIRPVSAVGFEDGYLDKIHISWAEDPYGRGPTGTAIRTGKVCVGRDFLSEPNLAPWREQALQRGFRSSIALPLGIQGDILGALTIYASEPNCFGQRQIELLSELAEDMAFGITALRAHAERDRARRELEEKAAHLRALSTQLVQAEARERRRLAQILHDSLQQLLVGARYNIEILRKQTAARNSEEMFERIDGLLAQCIQISRSLTAQLSPPILYEAGLASALRWLARWFQETHGLTVHLAAEEELYDQPEDIRVTLFQGVRELLFNVVKHAQVKQAEVSLTLEADHQVRITVSDCGIGFAPAILRATEGQAGGIGLFSLRERLESLGGGLSAESSQGHGSRFTLTLPLQVQAAAPGQTQSNETTPGVINPTGI